MAERSIRDPQARPLRARNSFEPASPRRPVDRERTRRPIDAEVPIDQPGPVRADRAPTDRRRLLAAVASSFLPGSGQVVNGRFRAALAFLVPTLVAIAAAWLFVSSDRPAMLVARAVAPPVLGALLVLNVVVLAWRIAAVAQAFLDRRYPLRPGRLGALGLAVIVAVTVAPHVLAWSYGTAAEQMFGKIFAGSPVRSVSNVPRPGQNERLNVLLIGLDSAPGRTESLTDTLIVVSLDPVGRTVSMVSIPRDLANVPLGNGNTFGPKINSLMSWAASHPKDYPDGGIRTLENAVSALFGIPIHAYASVDLAGFAAMVDAVGGVDIVVKKPLDDPRYPRLDGTHGWSITSGPHHLDGLDALAYARVRKVLGESDLTHAARQQEVLVALRNQAVSAGLLLSLPRLLDAIGSTVRTDIPQDQLPQLAALAEQIGGSSTIKLVLGAPEIRGRTSQYGSIFVAVPAKIRALAGVVFGPPGANPTWPVPKPSAPALAPSGSAAP